MSITHRIHGTIAYLPTVHDLVDLYGVHVGKYTSPMDGKGYAGCE